MRRVATTVVALCALGIGGLLAAGCGGDDSVRTVFTVEGMHCDSCSTAITTALEKTDGVVEASADWEQGIAEVVYHAHQVDVATLKAEIEDLGYTVTRTKTTTLEG
jgi:copper chaperone CopZ